MKPAETAVPTPPVAIPSASTSTMAVASTKGKEEGGEQKREKEQKGDADEVFSIELDLDSNSDLVFDWPREKIPKQIAGTEEAMQAESANTSGTPVPKDVPTPIEVQGEEEMETGEVAKVNRPTLEELAMAVACTPTPTPMPMFSITVSVPTPTPIPTTPGSLMPTPVPLCLLRRTFSDACPLWRTANRQVLFTQRT